MCINNDYLLDCTRKKSMAVEFFLHKLFLFGHGFSYKTIRCTCICQYIRSSTVSYALYYTYTFECEN